MHKPILMVFVNCKAELSEEFSKWYNAVHMPDFIKACGAVRGTRFQSVMDGADYNFLAMYEYENEESLREMLKSDALKNAIAEFDEIWGDRTNRIRMAFTPIFTFE